MPAPVNQLDYLTDSYASFDLWLEPHERGQGRGTAILWDLCTEADELGLELRIWCEPASGMGSPDALARWYERFGFERTGEVQPGRIGMVRRVEPH